MSRSRNRQVHNYKSSRLANYKWTLYGRCGVWRVHAMTRIHLVVRSTTLSRPQSFFSIQFLPITHVQSILSTLIASEWSSPRPHFHRSHYEQHERFHLFKLNTCIYTKLTNTSTRQESNWSQSVSMTACMISWSIGSSGRMYSFMRSYAPIHQSTCCTTPTKHSPQTA